MIFFDSVQLGATDPETAARAYELLFGRAPVRLPSGGNRFQLDRGAVEIEAGEPGLRSLRFTAGDDVSPDLAGGDLHGLAIRLAPVITGGAPRDSRSPDRGASPDSEASPEHARGAPPSPPDAPPARLREVSDIAVPPDQVHALDHVVIRSTDLERAIRLWRDRLGIRLALDREFPGRGLRMLFFRSSGVTLEFVSALGAADSAGADALDGLAYQVGDLAACRARLVQGGLDVSPVRDGHKRGTRVATVRSGTEGVPTLLIEHPAREASTPAERDR